MKANCQILVILCLVAGWAVIAQASFYTTHTHINVAGTFNDFDATTPNMEAVGEDIWQAYIELETPGLIGFTFVAPGSPNIVWGAHAQGGSTLPLFGTATEGGSPIVASNIVSGTYRFVFNAATLHYSFEDVSLPMFDTSVWVNELHYDNSGADVDEGVEIAGNAGMDLLPYRVYWYNQDGNLYSPNFTQLSGSIPDEGQGFGAIWFARAGIQNGPDDGFALVRNQTEVIALLSYQGTFTARQGPATGMTSTDIGVAQSPPPPIGLTLQLKGTGSKYEDFTWTAPSPHSRGSLNEGQTFIRPPVPASVSISNVVVVPQVPVPQEPVHVRCEITPIQGASNITAVTYWRRNIIDRFSAISMSASGTTYQTSTPIPGLPGKTRVQYFVAAYFNGRGTNSPSFLPANPFTQPFEYVVSRLPKGAVWINEVNYVSPWLFGPDNYEFIELAGLAGSDITGWSLEFVSQPGITVYASFVMPPAALKNQANGFGFWVLGDISVPFVDAVFTHTPDPNGSHLLNTGGIRLLNENGVVQYELEYGVPGQFEGFEFIGFEDDFITEDALSLSSPTPGSAYSNFAWQTTQFLTPGQANQGQVLTNGNTNPLTPLIICPEDLALQCHADVPPPNPSEVIALGLCGAGSVVVTHTSDTLLGGSGCLGNPAIIWREYMAVSECSTTSTCVQVIRVEDTTPPSIQCPPSTLFNPDFEGGDLGGWSIITGPGTLVSISSSLPQSGGRHAAIAFSNSAPTQAGLQQTLPASPGQKWLGVAHVQHLATAALSSNSTARMEIQFLNNATQAISTATSLPLTANSLAGVYWRLMLEATAPQDTAYARLLVSAQHDGTQPTTLYLDNTTLTPFYLFATNGCAVEMPDMTLLVAASDNCGTPDVFQAPAAGATIFAGDYQVRLAASDCGDHESACIMALKVLDLNEPTIACPAPLHVESIEMVPVPNPDALVAFGTCGPAEVIHVADTQSGGAGTAQDPLLITRTYLALDMAGNMATCVQEITVGGEAPGPAHTVEIVRFSLAGSVVAIDSTGANTWETLPEYSTNLWATPQDWMQVLGSSTIYSNGLLRTTFPRPDTNSTFSIYRVRQEAP